MSSRRPLSRLYSNSWTTPAIVAFALHGEVWVVRRSGRGEQHEGQDHHREGTANAPPRLT